MDASNETPKNQKKRNRQTKNKQGKTVSQKSTQTTSFITEDESSLIDKYYMQNLENEDSKSNPQSKKSPNKKPTQTKKKQAKSQTTKSKRNKAKTFSIKIVPKTIQRNLNDDFSSNTFQHENSLTLDDSSEIFQHSENDQYNLSNFVNPKYQTYQYFTTKRSKRAPLNQTYKTFLQKQQTQDDFPSDNNDLQIQITYKHQNDNDVNDQISENVEQINPNYPVCKFCDVESLLNRENLIDENDSTHEEEYHERTLQIVAVNSDDLENMNFEEEEEFYLPDVDSDVDDLDSFRQKIEINQKRRNTVY